MDNDWYENQVESEEEEDDTLDKINKFDGLVYEKDGSIWDPVDKHQVTHNYDEDNV